MKTAIQTMRHFSLTLVSLLLTGSWVNVSASQTAQLPCAVWSADQSSICLRTPASNGQHLTTTLMNQSSNLAVDQALGSLKNDILIVKKPEAIQTPTMQVALRNQPAPIQSKVKNNQRAQAHHAVAIKAPLTRSQIVKQELQREKAALRAAENQLNKAKKSGKDIQKWERQVSDRRASISAMQSELARL